MTYWFEYWWLLPIALAICTMVCLVGVERSIMFAPFFPWLTETRSARCRPSRSASSPRFFGFTSSFVGFYRARLIDFRLGLRTTAVGVPLALVGVVLAYRIPQPALLVIVAVVLPALAWYLRRPAESRPRNHEDEPRQSEEKVRAAATRIPLCCYASGNYYTRQLDPASQTTSPPPTSEMREHRDRQGRRYRYAYRGRGDQLLVGSVGGLSDTFG